MSSAPMTDYLITWQLTGYPQKLQTRVTIIDGYSTLDDAPKIIAIARLGDRDLAGRIRVVSAEPIGPSA